MPEQNNNPDTFNIRKAALTTFAAFAIGSSGAFIVTETIMHQPESIELLYDFIGGTALATVTSAAAMDTRKKDAPEQSETGIPYHTTGRNE